MSDRSYVAMRSAARDPPAACTYARATMDPMFNESFPMPLPPAASRKYEDLTDYRGYTIATFKSSKPLYRVSGVPVFVVYLALDDVGDALTPVETCFWSPFLAMAFIDQYIALSEHEHKAYWKKQGPWRLMHQNYNAQHRLPALLDAIRCLAAEACDPDADLMFDGVAEFGRHIASRITQEMEKVNLSDTPKSTTTIED